MRIRLPPAAVAAIPAAALGLLAAPPGARAGNYSVWACANGSGAPLGPGDWSAGPSAGDVISDTDVDCGQASPGTLTAVARSAPTAAPESVGTGFRTAAPAGVTFRGVDLWWVTNVNPAGTGNGRVQVYAEKLGFGGLAQTAWYRDDSGEQGTLSRDPAVAYGERNRQSFGDLQDSNFVQLTAWCKSGCNGAQADTARFTAYRTRITAFDGIAPTGSASGLAPGTSVTRPVAIAASATDAGAGVRDLSLRVDGQVRERTAPDGTCADVDPANADPLEYGLAKPCTSARTAILQLLPTHFPDGEPHRVTAVATDAAGNETVLLDAVASSPGGALANPDLDLGAPRSVNGTNGGPSALRVGFPKRTRVKRRTVTRLRAATTRRFGSRVRISGRLTAADGKPIAGARVYRITRPGSGQAWRVTGGAVRTSRTGGFSASVRASGPSRQLAVAYFPWSDSNTAQLSRTLRLGVQAPVTLRVVTTSIRRGGRFRIVSKLGGGFRGTVVGSLQFYARGGWQPFGTLRFRASRKGVVRFSQRSRTGRPGQRIRLRVEVPEQNGMKFETGRSPVRVLRVR